MTRKDYIKVARLLKVLREAQIKVTPPNTEEEGALINDGWQRCLQLVVAGMTNIFSEDNPRFDRDKFWKACGEGD